MIEPIMFIGIGFLVAGLLVIGVIPMVHARAVRLTMRRVEALTPFSMAEIQAEKDQLRAEFAMSTRRLEMSVEQMKAKTTNQLAEIGKKSEAIGRLKLELGEKTAALFALEAKEKQMADDLRSIAGDLAAKSTALEAAERALASTRAELGKLTSNLSQNSVASDSQRVELVASRAQTEILKAEIATSQKELAALRDRLARETGNAEAKAQHLTEERARAESLSNRVGELERQLVAQTTESEVLGRRVQELSSRLEEQGRLLADREYASEQSQQERAKLQRELASMQRQAEGAANAESLENAVLRERINDIAAEVARLTATLEGPNSPIEAILEANADRPATTAAGTAGEVTPLAPSSGAAKGTLADRIRALQSRASRLPQPSGA
jgi:chromosome segregation ATPase